MKFLSFYFHWINCNEWKMCSIVQSRLTRSYYYAICWWVTNPLVYFIFTFLIFIFFLLRWKMNEALCVEIKMQFIGRSDACGCKKEREESMHVSTKKAKMTCIFHMLWWLPCRCFASNIKRGKKMQLSLNNNTEEKCFYDLSTYKQSLRTQNDMIIYSNRQQ